MKKISFFLVGILFIMALTSCESSSHRYSDTYYNDSEYRQNVKDISDVYGVSEAEVDAKINAVTNGY